MAESKYKGGFGHKQAKTPAKKQKPMMTYEELAKYVKSVNPYKGVAGVVNEVTSSLYPKIAAGGAIAPKAVSDYFENNIPYSVQMSSAYIQEMVKQYRAEQGLKPAKASDEAVAYIRNKLRATFLPLKEEVTAVSPLDYSKMVNKKTGQLEVKDYAKAHKDGFPAVTGYSQTEYIGGKIKYLYADSQKYNRAAQFRRENVERILTEHGVTPTEDVINYITTEFKRQVMDELRSANITADRTKPPRAFIRGIEDYGGRMALAAVQMQQKLSPTVDADFLESIGDDVTFGDVEKNFSGYITDKGVKAEYLLNTLRDSLRRALGGRTTERMIPYILAAIQEGTKTKTGEEIAEAVEGIFADRLAPASYDQIYLPEKLAGWVYKVLPRLWVPEGMVVTIYSDCFNETPEDYIENIKNNHAKRKKNPNRASWVLP